MGFRFRKSIGGRGFRINLSKNGISSISIGRAPFTVNVPVNRPGGTRTTISLPGTGMSWSEEAPAGSRRRLSASAAPQEQPIAKEPATSGPNDQLLKAYAEAFNRLVNTGYDDLLSRTEKPLRADFYVLAQQLKQQRESILQDAQAQLDDEQLHTLRQWLTSNSGSTGADLYQRWLLKDQELHQQQGRRAPVAQQTWTAPPQPLPQFPWKVAAGLLIGVPALLFAGATAMTEASLWQCNQGDLTACAMVNDASRITNKAFWADRKAQAEAAEAAAADRRAQIAADQQRAREEQQKAEALLVEQAQAEQAAKATAASAESRMNADGYYQGAKGGCFRYTSSGNKDYVSRSICNSY